MNLEKIINLVKKTNDKVIITDESGDASFVLMPFADYEKIIENKESVKDLSEKEMLDQIDCDIAVWKQEHDDEEEDESQFDDPFGNDDENEDEDDIDEDFKISEQTEKPVKYENIPPPPDITTSDIFQPEEKPIIDMSFDEEGSDNKIEDDFEEEPVF